MKIFTKVKCKAYMKKVDDGVYIQMYNPDGTCFEGKNPRTSDIQALAYQHSKVIKDLSGFDGDCVEKTYRVREEVEFTGFLVGITHIKRRGLLGTDWDSSIYTDHGYCWKRITDYPAVGVVYFKNNVKRYVLLEDMEEIK